MNVTDFVESKYVLDQSLFPVQRLILKSLYGIPLDTKNKTIKLYDRWVRELTEADYLKYLHDRGRSNIREVEYGHEFSESCVVLGRRSGKSYLQSLCSTYEMERALDSGSGGHVQSISLNKEQAGNILREVLRHVQKTCLHQRVIVPTQSYVSYRSENPKETVEFHSNSCHTKGLLTRPWRLVTLDEWSHFEEAYEIRAAVSSTVVTPRTEKLFLFTSPAPASTNRHHLLRDYRDRQGKHLFLQIPTWEVNPTIPSETFEQYQSRDPEGFALEFGAEIP